nr:immunoglobulin light chain junction region [Macaca mulatta]
DYYCSSCESSLNWVF